MGLVMQDEKNFSVLTDILGEEDQITIYTLTSDMRHLASPHSSTQRVVVPWWPVGRTPSSHFGST